MRAFAPIALDTAELTANLTDLEALLAGAAHLKEWDHVTPFFKARPQLCATLGYANSALGLPDRYALELDLFGDFVFDVAAGFCARVNSRVSPEGIA